MYFGFILTSLGALEGGRETKDLKVACATLVWYHWLSRTSTRLKMVFIISTYQGLICVLGVHAFLMLSRSSISICDFPIKASQKLVDAPKLTPRQKHPPQYEKKQPTLN